MKNFTLISYALLALLFTARVQAQSYIVMVKPAGGKHWGYANLKGELIIPAQFEKCYRFSEDGYATVYDSKERQYYFINPKGEKLATEVASFKLNDGFGFDMEGFRNGLVGVKIGEKWGYMNTNGKIAIPAKYDHVTEFKSGYGVAKLGSTFIILNTKGEETMIQGGNITDVKEFSEGLAPYKDAGKKHGFMGPDGKPAITAQFESVGYFSNGLAWAKITGGAVGYINPKGEWVIKPQFESAKNFDASTGLARIKTQAGSWAYVNKAGELTYVNDTEAWGDFSDGLAEGKKGDKRGFYDSKGKWAITPQFDGTRDFKNGYAAAKMGKLWGVIDKTGKWVIQPSFDGIKDVEVVK